MNYTENYHLPQWEETDRIMRTDFNQMCADMESGLNANAQAAAELPYVVGSYVGTGQEITITLGFRPSFVIISGMTAYAGQNGTSNHCVWSGETLNIGRILVLTDTGFTVRQEIGIYPQLSDPNKPYDYIAFR